MSLSIPLVGPLHDVIKWLQIVGIIMIRLVLRLRLWRCRIGVSAVTWWTLVDWLRPSGVNKRSGMQGRYSTDWQLNALNCVTVTGMSCQHSDHYNVVEIVLKVYGGWWWGGWSGHSGIWMLMIRFYISVNSSVMAAPVGSRNRRKVRRPFVLSSLNFYIFFKNLNELILCIYSRWEDGGEERDQPGPFLFRRFIHSKRPLIHLGPEGPLFKCSTLFVWRNGRSSRVVKMNELDLMIFF